MYVYSYALLLVIALILNLRDRDMLAVSVVVGIGVFVPVPAHDFYAWCVVGELIILLVAKGINAEASMPIMAISGMLAVMHCSAFFLDGYPRTSPYHMFVKICEHAELASCILFSKTIQKRLRHARNPN